MVLCRIILVIGCLFQSLLPAADIAEDLVPLGIPTDVSYPGELEATLTDWWLTGWDESHRTPVWVAYHLPKRDRFFPVQERPSRFFADRDFGERGSPRHDDYTRSGFDRGHLAPNHAIALLWGREAQLKTFSTGNIAPQRPAHNRGPWRILESRVLAWSQARGGVWVITGLAYDRTEEDLASGIEIPDAWWKVIIDQQPNGSWDALAFLIDEGVSQKADPDDFRVSIDRIEAVTGLDLLATLPDRVEDNLEQRVNSWRFAPAVRANGADIAEPARQKPAVPGIGLININTASLAQLDSLPGVGEVIARRIIAGRPFHSADDLQRVSGIGPKRAATIAPLVRFK